MQRANTAARRWLLAAGIAAAAVLWWLGPLVWLAAKQLFLGMLTATAALPVMKRLEKRWSPGLSAALAIAALNAALAAALFLLLPALAQQGRQLLELLPGLWSNAQNLAQKAQNWLAQRGFSFAHTEVQAAIAARVRQALGTVIPRVAGSLGGFAGSMGQWLLAPVFGFYFLRDRREICCWLISLVPVGWREMTVRMFGEMRRETAGYLRGQLLVSLIVGGLTAAGLLLCGVPSWLALGAAMGALELIPYVGPLIGAALALLFALPLGLWKTLWALGVVIAVQQAEGSVLSPRLISQTTRLHPAVVLLCAVVGGAAAGVTGIVLSVPLLLCLRACARVALWYAPRR